MIAAAGASKEKWQLHVQNVPCPAIAVWCMHEGGPPIFCTACRNAGGHDQMVHRGNACHGCGDDAFYGNPLVPFPGQTHCRTCSNKDVVFRVDLPQQRKFTRLQSDKELKEITHVLNEVIERIDKAPVAAPVAGSFLSSKSTGATCALPSNVLRLLENNEMMAQAMNRCNFVSIKDESSHSMGHRSTNVKPPPPPRSLLFCYLFLVSHINFFLVWITCFFCCRTQ
jgi:hypothetical protein